MRLSRGSNPVRMYAGDFTRKRQSNYMVDVGQPEAELLVGSGRFGIQSIETPKQSGPTGQLYSTNWFAHEKRRQQIEHFEGVER
jgi:hypothetical protein